MPAAGWAAVLVLAMIVAGDVGEADESTLAGDKHASIRVGRFTGHQVALSVTKRHIHSLQVDVLSHPHKLVSTKHRFLICLMQKVGCTNWLHYIKHEHGAPSRTAVLYTDANMPKHGLYYLNKQLSQENLTALVAVLQDPGTFKTAIVRHPWSRAVRDKVFGMPYKTAHLYGIKTPRTAVPDSMRDAQSNITFHEFVEALAFLRATRRGMINAHFLPQTELCELGTFPYDYLAELHNRTDLEYIARRMGFQTSFEKLESQNIERYGEKGAFGGTAHEFPCTPQTVDLIAQIYAKDLRVLGYNLDEAYHSCSTFGLTSEPRAH